MELLARGAFSIFGNPSGGEADNTGTAMLFEEHLLEQMLRVQQTPKMRKISGGPKGKSDFEREA